MTPEERLILIKERLEHRLSMARRVLDEAGYHATAVVIPVEEVLLWLEEE